jgi:ribosomal protein S10
MFVPKYTYIKTIHEPEYLDALKPQIPFYELTNCQVRGYDYAVLEAYVRLIQKTAQLLKITINGYWATPCVSTRYDSLMADSEIVEASYKVNLYERNIQFKYLTVAQVPLLIEAIQQAKPAGVVISVHLHTEDDTIIRYIPDLALEKLEAELKEWKQPFSLLQHKKI